MRVGRVVRLVPQRQFGFIQADEFRNDVFFHFSVVESGASPEMWTEGQEVEFDLDELKRLDLGELKASLVRPARRPLSHKMKDEVQEPRFKAKHHVRARQKRPTWRGSKPPKADPQNYDGDAG
jgi:cold shock CspA family protein